ncbi:hypothetical protein [Candidatus Laterigemmans baculatus]|uniref:hypothetical protein n=1 Tax=Candidatus Laterigemmans baculatus TaxID=2770505 RepID=UPI0013DBAB2C|nr:hypothetical protein [Candidatus Laterigemmans baculatus]
MSPPHRKPPQMSLSFMLLMNVIFCVLAGAVYWASRVPAVASEVSVLLGGSGGGSGSGSRKMHVIFVMFTYTAPLLLAGVLSTLLGFWRYFERRRSG